MRLISTFAIVALAATPVVAMAQAPASQAPAPASAAPAAPAPAAPAKPAFSTSETTIGALMANPAAKEAVLKHLPLMAEAGENPQAAAMTLKDVQQYLPELDDKTLAALDADLAKVPAK